MQHVDGLLQLADLATKLHPRGRLVELLHLWGFQGLAVQTSGTVQLKTLYVLCVMVVLAALPVAAAEDHDQQPKASLKVMGLDELTFLTLVICVAAIGLWEFLKMVVRWLLQSRREERRRERLHRLRRLAVGGGHELRAQ